MNSDMTVIGVVLAGGESRRMKQDKGNLPVNGDLTLLHRQFGLLKHLSLDSVVISRHQKHNTPADLLNHVVSDRNPNLHDGPLAGIHAVATAYPEATAALILPVDLPRMNVELLGDLLYCGGSRMTTTHYRNEFFPLLLMLGQSERDYLAEQLEVATGNRSVHSLLQFSGAEEIDHAHPDAFTNTNTESEWQAAQPLRILHE